MNTREPDPNLVNSNQAVWDWIREKRFPIMNSYIDIHKLKLVLDDVIERDKLGEEKYGIRLKPFNGRKPLVDAYQEALDLWVYLSQDMMENPNSPESTLTIIELLICDIRQRIETKYEL